MSRDDEAARWFARLRAPDGKTAQAAFDAWRRADPANAHAFAVVESDWALAAATAHRPSPAARGVHRRRIARPAFLAGSALAAIAACALVVAWTGNGRGQRPLALIEGAEASPSAFRLIDGSSIVLDRTSRAAIDFDENRRRVVLLRGRGRFRVAVDARRPFTVEASRYRVAARQSVFDVALRPDGVDVTSFEGPVEVTMADAAGATPVVVTSGQNARAERHGVNVAPLDPMTRDWPAARLAVNGERLDRVVALANQLGGTAILIDDTLAPYRVTGVFDIREPVALARKLAAAFDLEVVRDASAVRLKKKDRAR